MYDVVVAGAGSAGLFLAYRLAKKGFKVAVVESKPSHKIGEKVCGDAVGKHHFEKLGVEPPRIGEDATSFFKGVRVFSPNKKAYVTAWGEGYALDRKAFGQKLLKWALNAGAELLDSHTVVKPIVEGTWVKGLEAVRSDGARVEVGGKVTVDATGVSPVLRTKLPESWWVSERIPEEDYIIAYRVIARVEREQETELALIYLDPTVAPGGYWWWFPKGRNEVNVGLGVQFKQSLPRPEDNFAKYIEPYLREARAEVVHEGSGVCPTRRTIACMVWNGFAVIGDAACTANPIHGGGIGPSMLSADAAAKAITEAFEKGEPSLENLWKMHRLYHEAYGAKQAGLDVLRIYLQKLSSADLDFVIEKKIVTDEELAEMGYRGELVSAVISKTMRALKLLSRPSLLKELVQVKNYMDKARKLYLNYPESPEGFEKWYSEQKKLFDEVKRKYAKP